MWNCNNAIFKLWITQIRGRDSYLDKSKFDFKVSGNYVIEKSNFNEKLSKSFSDFKNDDK